MTKRHTASLLTAVLSGLAAVLLVSPRLAEGQSGVLPVFEDFEQPVLDPALQLAGDPEPELVTDDPIAGLQSLRIGVPPPDNAGNPPIIICCTPSTSVTRLDSRWWIDLSTLSLAEGNGFLLAGMATAADPTSPVAALRLRRQGGDLQVAISIATDVGMSVESGWLGLDPAAVASGLLAVRLTWEAARNAIAADGSLRLDVLRSDGSTMVTSELVGVDNDSHLVNRFDLGVLDAASLGESSGHFLLDELSLRE